MRPFTLACLCALFFSSCEKDKIVEHPGASERSFSFTAVDSVQIPIDTTTSNFLPTFSYTEFEGKRLLLLFNHKMRRLQAYDLDTRTESFKIQFQSEGPDAIPDIGGFLFHNYDSIFLFTLENENLILLADSTGIKNRFTINEKLENGNDHYEITVESFFQPTFNPQTSILSVWVAPFIPRYTSKYYQYPLVIDYDIRTGKVVKNYGYYPAEYRGNDLHYRNELLYRLDRDTFEIHYFDNSHNLYLYNKQRKELTRTIFAKSKFVPEKIESIMKDGDEKATLQQQKNHFITKARYCRLLFDNENKLYYRMVRQSQELKNTEGLLNGKIDSKKAIMVLNDKFEYAGETELPGKTYMDDFTFVSRGVLWINTNHPENELNQENVLSFKLFKVAEQ